MNVKGSVYIVLLFVQLTTIGYWYTYGTRGLYPLYYLYQDKAQAKQEVELLKLELAQLENEVKEWHSDPYYGQKVAREQLQLVQSSDVIYLT